MRGFWHEYLRILSDLPHLAVELTFLLVLDILFLGVLVPLIKRWIRREHTTIDSEHGYTHEGDGEEPFWPFWWTEEDAEEGDWDEYADDPIPFDLVNPPPYAPY